MDANVLVALITVCGSMIVAGITFYFTKKLQMDSDWRKEKLDHYRNLLVALSDLAVDGKDKDNANERFALASNTIVLVAPQKVVNALMAFHDEVKFSNPKRSLKRHDELLTSLLLAIRKDIKLSNIDNDKTFQFHLIGSNPNENKMEG